MAAKPALLLLFAASLALAIPSGPASAACSARGRPPLPFDLKAAPKRGSETTTILFSWRWRFWSAGDRVFWDIEMTDGSGRIVESHAGVKGVSARNNFVMPHEVGNLGPGTTRCVRVRARTEARTEGCVSAGWSPRVCATTTSPPRPTVGAWAAVAADGKGHWGFAVGQQSEAEARTKAVQGCSQPACKVAMAGQGACIAYADSRAGGYWYGVSIVATKWYAESVAKDWCAKGAPRGTCKVARSVCR
jgi:hypothetical protein